ncbi:MAG: D-glycerate dehydrogenase [Candidatus Aminicenantes bacterium]|nr:D-glycerate dehydrogenase [Candidatus Aminicenantes bacterium]
MKKKVILTQIYQDEAIEKLKENYQLIIAEQDSRNLLEILKANPDTQALISFLSDDINGKIIAGGPNLKIIANYAVGYNNIDFQYAMGQGIYVTHTPDILTNATADLTMALILAVSRRIVEADAFLRKGEFSGWGANLMLGKELNGAILGIVGLGRIGLATAIRAKSFGMKVVYYDRNPKKELESRHGFEYRRFVDLIKISDVVSLHIPYSPDMHHLFNRDVFDLMKRDAIFINASRGPLMDERYLAEKLENQTLLGAGLDVYEHEPRVTEKLKKLNNAVLVPHIGSATTKARLEMAMMTVRSVTRALSGQVPDHLIPEWKRY